MARRHREGELIALNEWGMLDGPLITAEESVAGTRACVLLERILVKIKANKGKHAVNASAVKCCEVVVCQIQHPHVHKGRQVHDGVAGQTKGGEVQ